eukprot:scaffold327121_cov126-Tisochrysis_lutea.AAC.2
MLATSAVSPSEVSTVLLHNGVDDGATVSEGAHPAGAVAGLLGFTHRRARVMHRQRAREAMQRRFHVRIDLPKLPVGRSHAHADVHCEPE